MKTSTTSQESTSSFFADIFEFFEPRVRPNKKITKRQQLLLVLEWLRHYPSYGQLSYAYGISKTKVSKLLAKLVPKLLVVLSHHFNDLSPPEHWVASEDPAFNHVVGAIDCTSHYWNRVHPGQADWYRGDKHAHFMTAQVSTTLSGRIVSVVLGKGHNNDQGMFNVTKASENIIPPNGAFVADGGYSSAKLVTPDDSESREWNKKQKALRSVVEHVNSRAHNFAVASSKFKQDPEFQSQALMCVWMIVAHYLSRFPLRPEYAPPEPTSDPLSNDNGQKGKEPATE